MAAMSDLRTDALRGLCDLLLDNEDWDDDDVPDLLMSGRMIAAEMLRLLDEQAEADSPQGRLI